jgi:hypothetical protein
MTEMCVSWGLGVREVFDVESVVALGRELDPNRLLDADSGGGANDKHLADVNDVHSELFAPSEQRLI